MAFQIYQLTHLGKAVARSTSAPDNPEWRIIHFLDLMGCRDKSQIIEGAGITETQAATALRTLRHKNVIEEAGGIEVEV